MENKSVVGAVWHARRQSLLLRLLLAHSPLTVGRLAVVDNTDLQQQ